MHISDEDMKVLHRYLREATPYPYLDREYHKKAINKFKDYMKNKDSSVTGYYDVLSKDDKLKILDQTINQVTIRSRSYKRHLNIFKSVLTVGVLLLFGALSLSFFGGFTGQVITMFILGLTITGGATFGMCVYSSENEERYNGFNYSPPELLEVINKEYERVLISDE